MSDFVVVRNLTAQPLTIRWVERCDDSNPRDPNGQAVSGLTRISSHLTTSSAANGSATYGAVSDGTAQSCAQDAIAVRMEPFTTHKIDIKTISSGSRHGLKWILYGDGLGQWTIDTPMPSAASQKLVALVENPEHEYSAIYNPQASFLSIVESIAPQNWMERFRDDTPLSALSIPGTHNSPTWHRALPSVRCQAVSPVEQLQNGIRFFDIRVQPGKPHDPTVDTLNLVHGAFSVSLSGTKRFRDLVDEVQTFLRQNPSETIIMSLKREGTGSATDQHLSCILRDHYATDLSQWYTEPRIPSLGEVRGKIVLLRRFALDDRAKREWEGRGWCLDAENWTRNTPDCTHGDVRVQDFYEVLETVTIDTKIRLCCDHLERAAQVVCPPSPPTLEHSAFSSPSTIVVSAGSPSSRAAVSSPPGPLYLNFLSASNFWNVSCWPERIAAKLNPAITAFLRERHCAGDRGIAGPGEQSAGDGGAGIVVCDWVGLNGDWDLVRTIVALNGLLLLRQRGVGGGGGGGRR